MKDRLLRRLTYIASAVGVLPLYLTVTFMQLRDAEPELVVLSVLIAVIYLLFIPSLIAAITVIFKRDAHSAASSVLFFCLAYSAELAVMTVTVMII